MATIWRVSRARCANTCKPVVVLRAKRALPWQRATSGPTLSPSKKPIWPHPAAGGGAHGGKAAEPSGRPSETVTLWLEKALMTTQRLRMVYLPASLYSLLWRTTVLPQALYGCEVRNIRPGQLVLLASARKAAIQRKVPPRAPRVAGAGDATWTTTWRFCDPGAAGGGARTARRSLS